MIRTERAATPRVHGGDAPASSTRGRRFRGRAIAERAALRSIHLRERARVSNSVSTAIVRACAPAAAAVRDEPGHLGAVNFWLAAGRSSSVCRNRQVHRQIERENDRITENLQPPLSVLV